MINELSLGDVAYQKHFSRIDEPIVWRVRTFDQEHC